MTQKSQARVWSKFEREVILLLNELSFDLSDFDERWDKRPLPIDLLDTLEDMFREALYEGGYKEIEQY